MSSLSVEVLSCFEVKPRRRRGESDDDVANREAFRLAINADQRERLISDWFFNPSADRRADDRRRSYGSKTAKKIIKRCYYSASR